jgi:hypothetical protein
MHLLSHISICIGLNIPTCLLMSICFAPNQNFLPVNFEFTKIISLLSYTVKKRGSAILRCKYRDPESHCKSSEFITLSTFLEPTIFPFNSIKLNNTTPKSLYQHKHRRSGKLIPDLLCVLSYFHTHRKNR